MTGFAPRAVTAVIRHYSDNLKLKVNCIGFWLLLLSQLYCLVTTFVYLVTSVLETESELNCLVAAFDKPDILSGDYFCLESYISSDCHFLVVYSLVLLSGDRS